MRIELWVEEIRASRFTVAYELFDGDVLASRARSVLVPFDLTRQRAPADHRRGAGVPARVRPAGGPGDPA